MDISNMKPIDVKVADLSDEDLEMIVNLRKKIRTPLERRRYVGGLYYISLVDDDYSDAERALVEGTACALGINSANLDEIIDTINNSRNPITAFAYSGDKKFKEALFQDMGALTYIKGYQLSTEDEALKKVAGEMKMPEAKADSILSDLYLQSQGIIDSVSTKSTTAKIALGAGGILAGAAICALTAGVAAPAIGAAIGGGMGLSGAAATSAGLAVLGGGALAAGGGGVAAGTAAVIAAGALAGGGGVAMSLSVKENIAGAYDKKKLKAAIKKQQKENMTKQEITENLIKAIEVQKKRLAQLEEKQASKRDLATVKLQIANLEAEKAEFELEAGE